MVWRKRLDIVSDYDAWWFSAHRAVLTHGPSVGRSLVRRWNLIIRVGCALVVCRISGSGIRKAALRSVWIVNDRGRYHSQSKWIPAVRLAMLNAMATPFENLEEQIRSFSQQPTLE
jgi:hypothetical protein